MIINIIGNCDKRPVLYTVMKICQTLGDVLVITNNARLLRLSDTRDSFGHYQNTMIAYTQEGIDDFLDDFNYDFNDFEYTIVDNIVLAEANLTIYVEGLLKDESEMDLLEYIESYQTIELYKGNLLGPKTLRNLECFEAFANMQPISAKLAERVAVLLEKLSIKTLRCCRKSLCRKTRRLTRQVSDKSVPVRAVNCWLSSERSRRYDMAHKILVMSPLHNMGSTVAASLLAQGLTYSSKTCTLLFTQPESLLPSYFGIQDVNDPTRSVMQIVRLIDNGAIADKDILTTRTALRRTCTY